MVVKKGDKISVDYEGRFENGEVFDSSRHGDHSHPLGFEVGLNQVIKGFDDAVIGMKIGDEKEIKILPSDAYGEIDQKLIQEIPKSILPKGKEPKEGMVLMMNDSDAGQVHARIIKILGDKVTLDLNHPLAGKTLIFKIKILEIG